MANAENGNLAGGQQGGSAIDNEIMRGAEEDAREVAFIQNYMGVENRELFTEEDIYYCLDVLME